MITTNDSLDIESMKKLKQKLSLKMHLTIMKKRVLQKFPIMAQYIRTALMKSF